MTTYFMDTSAIVKNYVQETGWSWVQGIITPVAGNSIVISTITSIEFLSALERKQRENTLKPADASIFRIRFIADIQSEYLVVKLSEHVQALARQLVMRHPLRTLDSIQLASAMEFRNAFPRQITFVSGDKQLLTAATGEGFATDDPKNHP